MSLIDLQLSLAEKLFRGKREVVGLRGKIEALRQEQQVVLSLIYVENLTHQQVATAMGKQVDEIENILKRAIETLQLACGSTRETAY